MGDWSRGEREERQVSEVELSRERKGEEENGTLEYLDVSAHRIIGRQVWTSS